VNFSFGEPIGVASQRRVMKECSEYEMMRKIIRLKIKETIKNLSG